MESPWARRSAVRVMASQRPAQGTLHLSDEYGEVDVEISASAATASRSRWRGASVTLGSVSLDGGTLILSNAGQDTAYAVWRDGAVCYVSPATAWPSAPGLD